MTNLEAFQLFHKNNPQVYEQLVKYCRIWRKAKGKNAKLGINMLIERVRWDFSLQTKSSDAFKINNNHAPFYARRIMDLEHDLKDIFNLREQKAA